MTGAKNMVLEFDEDAGALYLRLGKVASSEPLADDMILDIGEKGQLLGLELLLPREMKPEVKAMLLKAV